MKRFFTTGEFAKLANVTSRTLRYYDKQDILKPSLISDNGYRRYSEDDFVKLQRVISLKQLGFSLDEIKVMNLGDDNNSLIDSFQLQIDLLEKRVRHLENLKESLIATKGMIEKGIFTWEKMLSLLEMNNEDEKIIEHYKDERHLSIRIRLHQRYSINKTGWFEWLFQQIDFERCTKILELGCGTGELWKTKIDLIHDKEVFLTDISKGMVDLVQSLFGKSFNYLVMDMNHITFQDDYFDAVIANHVLFYLNDFDEGITKIKNVLKNDGILYCSTYGRNHLKEINELVKEFDSTINLCRESLCSVFGLENGEQKLLKHFSFVDKRMYEDGLIVRDSEALFSYIISCHGNQVDKLANRTDEFKQFLEEKINEKGYIRITKEAGLFICYKKRY